MVPENALTDKAKNELNKIKKIEEMVDRENLVYGTTEYTDSFKFICTINIFGRNIYNGQDADKDKDH